MSKSSKKTKEYDECRNLALSDPVVSKYNVDNLKIHDQFIEKYNKLLGDRFEEFFKYSLMPLKKAIRVNTLKITPKKLQKKMPDWEFEQVPWCKDGFWVTNKIDPKIRGLGNLPEHALGYFYVQDPASMIPPLVLDPKPGDRVLDMCAAPGSKSTQIAQYLKGEGLLVCNDNAADRLRSLEINIRRMGIVNVLVLNNQANHLDKLERDGVSFDKVLVDAPCSGSGTIRKSYKTLLKYNQRFIDRTAALQNKIIKAGFQVLKPGGTLVYSTCTLEPQENEETISYLINEFPRQVEVQEIKLPLKRSENITEWDGKKYHDDVKKTLRIYPQDNDSEGFFVAKIKKIK